MWTLGTVKRDITGSIWLSSAAVAVIGTVIALAVSIPGMSWAIGKLQELTGSELAMSVSPWQTAALCAVVLVLELAAVALCSALAARRGIRKAA
ncbi:MAG: FtsX-like permease family protein [Oscillospiraceae bacterium]